MPNTRQQLDKIIKLLEEIKASQPVPYYPPIIVPSVWIEPQPGYPEPIYPNQPTWIDDRNTAGHEPVVTYEC
jgi:hypothetical protein